MGSLTHEGGVVAIAADDAQMQWFMRQNPLKTKPKAVSYSPPHKIKRPPSPTINHNNLMMMRPPHL